MGNRFIALLIITFRVVTLVLYLLVYYITHPSEWSYRPHTSVVPACLRDPVYGKHCYLSVNGIKLHYVVSGPEDGQLILMLHGTFEFWYSWRYQIREFSKHYRVVALDLPGYGYSDKPTEFTHYNLTQMTSDIIELILAFGCHKCIIMGQSIGAAIGWNAVRTRPDLFSHFITISGGDMFSMDQSKYSTKTQSNFWATYFFRLPLLPEYMVRRNRFDLIKFTYLNKSNGLTNQGNMSNEDINAYLEMFKQENALTSIFNFYRCNRLGVANQSNRAKITVPTLLLWPEADDYLSKEVAEDCTTLVERFELNYLPCSHWVQQDMPQQVNTFIKDFLAFY